MIPESGKILGSFYSGDFDTAFSTIQRKELRGTEIRNKYDTFVKQVKRKFPNRGNIGFALSGWRPNGENEILGNHPEMGFFMGGEGNRLRFDFVLSYRFLSAKNEYLVDSLGSIISTDKFSSWYIGAEAGIKLVENSLFSTYIFVGAGYDVIISVTEDTEHEDYVTHGSISGNIGIRNRIFLNRQSGIYIGNSIKYNFVDYGNPGGTDLSGNTTTISFMVGWSFHETLNQFLKKLNYKGSWRP